MRYLNYALMLFLVWGCAGMTDFDREFLGEELAYALIANDKRGIAEDIVATLDIAKNPDVTGDAWNVALDLVLKKHGDEMSARDQRRLKYVVGKLSVAVEVDLALPLDAETRRIAGVYAAAMQTVLDEP